MSNLSMVEANLPPGFRFHPRDEELICDYLMKKVTCYECPLMIEVDLNKCEPWDIPETACVGGKDWYFYSQRDRKYATGLRTNRATVSGYWKATGKDRAVIHRGTLVGMRKTLVFYQGRAPKGRKTDWVMHEFRLEGPLDHPPKISSTDKEDWVLCRVFYKNKEAPAKQGIRSSYDDHDTSSSSLPALMDSYNITFDQTAYTRNEYEQQVPCFSIFSPNQINQTFSHINTDMEPINISTKTSTPTTFGGGFPDLSTTSCLNPLISCDKKVIKAVLNHFNKLDSNSSFTGEGSSESFLLSEVALPSMWNYC